MRIRDPFDGIRVGLIDQPVSLYDLSEGSGFVHSTVDMAAGSRLVLKVDLGMRTRVTNRTAHLLYLKCDPCGFVWTLDIP